MRIAALQYDPAYLAVEENLARVLALTGDLDVDLLVLPELFATGYFFRSEEDLASVAEEVPNGRTTQWLRKLAAEREMTVVAGLPERRGNRIYNSAVLVRADGSYAVYRKTHLFYEEKTLFTPGDAGFKVQKALTSDGDEYAIGTMICFDWYYPEAARSLALGGADIIVHPSNLVRKDCPRAMPIRALENHVFTVTANRIGRESNGREELTFIGQSLICSPDGEVIASAGKDEEVVIVADVDITVARDRQITPHNDLLRDRRPHLYRTDLDA
jgi:predicted amidohydrolase